MWSVENGVVICSSSKDYELQSWNEQGEITKIEGMLTVAFSFIFSCSHRDRKELYLIIKIPYMVNMSEIQAPPSKKPYYPKNYLLGDLRPFEKNDVAKEYSKLKTWVARFYGCLEKEWKFLFEKYELSPEEMAKALLKEFKRKDEKINRLEDQLRKQSEEFEQRIDKLEKEKNEQIKMLERRIEKLEKEKNQEIFSLKEKLGMATKWKMRGNSYYRWNPDLQREDKPCILPRNFDINKVDIKGYNEDKTIITYEYLDDNLITHKKRNMPVTLYDQLNEKHENKRRNSKNE